MILPSECNGPDCPFDGIGIEFNTAIVEESAQGIPASEAIADRIGEAAAGRESSELLVEPGL